LQYINTLTSVLDSTKIVPGQPISCRTLAVPGGHGATWSGYGRYSSEKIAQRKNTAAEGYEIKGEYVLKFIIDLDYWGNKDPVVPEFALVWFTDGSRVSSGTGSGIFGVRPNRSLCFPLGDFATVFQTEIYTILQCAY
jgi:hypothetical protein